MTPRRRRLRPGHLARPAPFLEIEGPDEHSVRRAAQTLGLDFSTATFGSVDELYIANLGRDILTEPRLVFT